MAKVGLRLEIEHVTREYAPEARLGWMIGLGANAVAGEQAAER